MIRVGIVAEGKSDCLALEEFMRAIHPDIDFMRLRPDMTLVSQSPFGWRGVKSWCSLEGRRLEDLLSGVPSLAIHILVVHVDCTMAHNVDALRPCPPASATADELRQVIVRDWLKRPTIPRFIVMATPSRSTDTWIVAALHPVYSSSADLECDDDAERELHRRRHLRLRDGEVKKPDAKYRPLVQRMAQSLNHVCSRCTEAARFRDDFAACIRLSAESGAQSQ